MSEEEYYASEPPEDQDLPSTFLSEEDLPGDTNVLIIPNYKINLDLILDGYVEMLTRAKTKDELHNVLEHIWYHAEEHGRISERLDKIQMDFEMLEIDSLLKQGYGIELVDDNED